MTTVRCKFVCEEVTKKFTTGYNKETKKNEPIPVYNSKFGAVIDGSEENKHFFKWTPTGKLEFDAHNNEAFEPGKEYYIDITLAE